MKIIMLSTSWMLRSRFCFWFFLHIESKSNWQHISKEESIVIEWIVKAEICFDLSRSLFFSLVVFFEHSYLMNTECFNTMTILQACASSNVIGCIDIADAIRQSTTFSSLIKPMTSNGIRRTKCLHIWNQEKEGEREKTAKTFLNEKKIWRVLVYLRKSYENVFFDYDNINLSVWHMSKVFTFFCFSIEFFYEIKSRTCFFLYLYWYKWLTY